MRQTVGYQYAARAGSGPRLVRALDALIVLVAVSALGLGLYVVVESARSTEEFAGIGVFLGLLFACWPALTLAAYGIAALLERRLPHVAAPFRVGARVVFGAGALVLADLAGWLPIGGGSLFWQSVSWALGGR